jgi:hypothetical protein
MNPMGYAPAPMGISPQRSQIAALMGNAMPPPQMGMPPQMGAPPAMAPTMPQAPMGAPPMGQPVAARPVMGMPRSLMR